MQTLFYNGEILTMEEPLYAEALLLEDGRILAVGAREELELKACPGVQRVDLGRKTLLPAFLDPHSHFASFATTLSLAQLGDAKSFEDIQNILRAFKKDRKLNDEDWIIAFGYDHNVLREKAHPTKDVLDGVSVTNPILITHMSGHMGAVNSKALKVAGISADTRDAAGGKIGRSPSGEPNGYLEEGAFFGIASLTPKMTLEDTLRLLEEAQQIYFQNGVTTIQEGLMKQNEFHLITQLAQQGRLKADVVGYAEVSDPTLFEEHPQYRGQYRNHFKIGGYKMILDGSPQGKTAWLTKPYEEEDEYRGYPVMTDEEVHSHIKRAMMDKAQLLTHCNGDAAADQLITAFEKVMEETKTPDTRRPVMIHAQTVRSDQLDRMKAIAMIPSYFVAHTYYWGDTHLKNLGERALSISPLATTVQKGMIFTLHQDSPVLPPDMLDTLWCAVNRKTRDGADIGEGERVSVLEALRGVTVYAAYQYFEEEEKGTLSAGKRADLVILSRNPLKVPPDKLREIQVMETIKDGETVYKR